MYDIFLGVAAGYITVSICESAFHRFICHAGPKLRKILKEIPVLGFYLFRSWFSHHVVHHYMTFRHDYTTQFLDNREIIKVNSIITSKGYDEIIRQSHGLRVGGVLDFIRFVCPTIPVILFETWIGWDWFSFGPLLPVILMPLASHFIHPYTHMSHERALAEAPAILRPIIKTKYFKHITIHHWMHHKYVHCNYNLLPGGDYILGVYRKPDQSDISEMALLGLPVANGPI